ncbi:unnamed protein product [Vicia faba]|uniref:Uncharacterized protein n=1 Tax=Vicia faba TaxID=3906 RepID=A0AAV0YIU5_VICFA|nr:unnamed protein product [Vicia faba]
MALRKEWKPKYTNTYNQNSRPATAPEAPPVSAEVTRQLHGPDSEKSSNSTPLSETYQNIEETVEEQDSSQNGMLTSKVEDYPDHPLSPNNTPMNLESGEVDGSSSAIQESNESKQDTALPSEGHQYPGMHISPNYSDGFVPLMLGPQLTPSDNSESQTHDISRFPSFIVRVLLLYGRLSPFASAGAITKYNGNITVLPAPNFQSPQEGILSTAGQTPLYNSSCRTDAKYNSRYSATCPSLPAECGSFIPLPSKLHSLWSLLFTILCPHLQQQSTNFWVTVPSFNNHSNPTHLVMPNTFGLYGSSPAGYNHNSDTTPGNSNSNEDLGSSQFKEINVYITGQQQSEGSAVWVAAPGRDMTNLSTSSFYNLPPQGPHVTYAPTQAGHTTFASIYHPAQAVTAAAVHPLLQQSQTMAGAVDMVGPGGNVYQQPQHAQINWPSNY